MEHPVALAVQDVLRRHPRPALTLSELVALVAERVDRGLTPGRLRTILAEHPDRFRVLEPFVGPGADAEAGSGVRHAGAAWALLAEAPVPPAGESPDTLRESVRWLGRAVDPRSRLDVVRWHAIARAERRLRGDRVGRAA